MEGQAIQKAARATNGIQLTRILNNVDEPMIGLLTRPKVEKGTKANKKRAAHWNMKTNIKEYALKYDFMTVLSNSLSRNTFGNLLRGDAMEAKKELRSLSTASSGNKVNDLAAESSSGRRVLKIVDGKVYGSEENALLDSVAVPNIISKSFEDRLSAIAEDTKKHITVSNVVKSAVLGLQKDVPVALDDLEVPLKLLIVEGYQFEAMIGEPDLEYLSEIPDVGKCVVHLTRNEKPLQSHLPPPEYKHVKNIYEETESEDSTYS